MATTAQNNLVKNIGEKRTLSFPIITDGTFDINQGDLLYYDTTAKIAKAVGSDANAQYLIGVADDSSFVNPYGTKKYRGSIDARFGSVHFFNTTTGETYNHGAALYIGADAQTVTTVAGTYPVGYVMLRDNQSAITGASGVTVDVLVVSRYPLAMA